mmetsp:Transcript_103889/g.289439  ORF Transcript_103889/g.289439 Transcript_103889/m.289439 type:complete len:223 (-) Transcript_103889:466-1134(-)
MSMQSCSASQSSSVKPQSFKLAAMRAAYLDRSSRVFGWHLAMSRNIWASNSAISHACSTVARPVCNRGSTPPGLANHRVTSQNQRPSWMRAVPSCLRPPRAGRRWMCTPSAIGVSAAVRPVWAWNSSTSRAGCAKRWRTKNIFVARLPAVKSSSPLLTGLILVAALHVSIKKPGYELASCWKRGWLLKTSMNTARCNSRSRDSGNSLRLLTSFSTTVVLRSV